MKTLYLVRHAKSSWNIADLPDIDRPLHERGYHDAHLASRHFLEISKRPELVISSPACRALSTALIFCRTLQYSSEQIKLYEKLYETNTDDYMHIVEETNEKISSLMLFAHNFTISELASGLLGIQFEEMPTCAVLGLGFNTDTWLNIHEIKAVQQFYFHPKMLKPI